MPELSIIVPVYKEDAQTLMGLFPLADIPEIELILVDGNGGSSCRSLPAHIHWELSPRGRSIQMNQGAGIAKSPLLLFLHADTRLPEGFLPLIRDTLAVYEAGAFSLSIHTSHPIIACIGLVSSLRARISRIPFGDQAQFFRRDTFFRIGSYPQIPILEDLSIMQGLKKQGIPIKILPQRVSTSDRRWRKEGICACTLRNCLLRIKYYCNLPPSFLSRYY